MLQFQWPPLDVAPSGGSPKLTSLRGLPYLTFQVPYLVTHPMINLLLPTHHPLPQRTDRPPVKTLASPKHNEGTLTLK